MVGMHFNQLVIILVAASKSLSVSSHMDKFLVVGYNHIPFIKLLPC
jgi:hypothetical protein